jgi:dipeptidyl aminopeptidase/acylaminoacyl peptidase
MRSIFTLLVITLICAVGPALAQKRALTEKDLFAFTWVADPQISPDGSRVVFVRVTVNDKKDGYNTSIWTVSIATGDAHQLTNGTRDSSPRWSPDGKFLVFVRTPERDGRVDPPQLFMLSMAGGESFPFTSLPRGASGPQWSPDGKTISFFNSATPEELAKQAATQRPQASPSPSPSSSSGPSEAKKPDEPRESDVRVITRAVYRSNGGGYNDTKHSQHIWTVSAPLNGDDKVTPRQLTSGRYDDGSVVWARDSSQIYFTSDHTDEPYYDLGSTDIYSIPVAGGQPAKLTSLKMGASGFTLSPNGRQLAFTGSLNEPVHSYTEPDLWVIDLALNAQPRNLTLDFDYDVGGGVGGDNTAPRGGGGSPPVWTADGRGIIDVYTKEGKANLGLFDVTTGKETDLTSANQAVVGFRATPDAAKLALIISTPTRIGDIFYLQRTPDFVPKQLTHLNDELFAKINLTEPEEVRW